MEMQRGAGSQGGRPRAAQEVRALIACFAALWHLRKQFYTDRLCDRDECEA